ncbi:MAG: hypothetical protein WDO17_10130 [Alphaproteobacteria bacterium]
MSLASLKPADFEPHIGHMFAIEANGQQVDLKLAAVERVGAAVREGGAFSLLFLSAPGPFVPQGVYPLQHPTLGTFELFMVPLGPKDGGNSYQIIFT